MNTTTECPSCNLRLPQYIDFCPECGQDFCPSCSEPIGADASSCSVCGEEFELHCPRCDAKVSPTSAACDSCGLSFDNDDKALASPGDTTEIPVDDESVSLCPICEMPYYLEDGFCRECGQTFCINCGHETKEEDDHCPKCNLSLYFDCPLCGFELTSGTEVCPNCDAFFPNHCTNCNAKVTPGEAQCPQCLRPLLIRQRKSARTVKSVALGQSVIRIVACPGCGHDFDPINGECPECHLPICSQCQLVLDFDEQGCPRCGILTQVENAVELCAYCHRIVDTENGECPFCQLVHCPECLILIPDEAEICPACGIEFEYLCPSCNREVNASALECIHCGSSFGDKLPAK
jgi:predicted amidophosphoribosyltransferase